MTLSSVTANPGSGGAAFATDDISSVNYSIVKLATGAAGTANLVTSLDTSSVTIATLPGTAAEAAALPSVFVVVAGDDGTDTHPLQLTAGGDLKITLDSEVVAASQSGTWIVDSITNSVAVTDNGGSLTVDNSTLSVVGTGTEATALRVTIATDSTGVLSVDDNGGSLTVDGTVAATQSGTWTVDSITNVVSIDDNAGSITVDGTVAATQSGSWTVAQGTAAAASGGWPIRASDGSNLINVGDNANSAVRVNVVAGSTSGTEYTEDAASAGGETGPLVLGVRNDAGTSPVSTDGDYHALQFDSSGRLRVVTQGASGGTSSVDDAAFTVATDSGTPIMGVVTADAVDSGDVGVVAMTTARALHVSIENDSVGIGGGTQYAVDAALGSTPTGTLALAIRDDALSTLTPIEGDAIGLRVDSTGALWVAVTDGGGSITVDNTALNVTGGGLEATALRVTLASDSTGVLSIDDNDSTISIDDGASSITVDNAALSVTGGGVEASALRVTLANDSTGVVSVDDNGSSLTIDNAALSVTGGGTESGALRVTLANDSTGVVSVDDNSGSLTVDNGGTFAVQAGLQTNAMFDGTTSLTPKFAIIDAATSGDNTLVAAVTSKKIRVLSAFLVSAGTVNVRFESGASGTALTGQMNLVANTGFCLPFNPVGWFETAATTLLNLELSAAISVDGSLVYVEV